MNKRVDLYTILLVVTIILGFLTVIFISFKRMLYLSRVKSLPTDEMLESENVDSYDFFVPKKNPFIYKGLPSWLIPTTVPTLSPTVSVSPTISGTSAPTPIQSLTTPTETSVTPTPTSTTTPTSTVTPTSTTTP